jgi:GNAT superfamily N-acetyltransferase
MLSRCTEPTRRKRFQGPRSSFPEPYLTEVLSGHPEHFALVAATSSAAVVALASCRNVGGDAAELAVLVEDAWQRQRIGARLLNRLIEHADRSGLRMLIATVPAENAWIVRALRSYGTCTAAVTMGVFQVTVRREPHRARPHETTAATSPRPGQLAPGIAAKVRASLASQQMMTLLGAQLIELNAGLCVLSLAYRFDIQPRDRSRRTAGRT